MGNHPKLQTALEWASVLLVPACYIILGAAVFTAVRAIVPAADSIDITAGFDLVLIAASIAIWRRVRANHEHRKLSGKGRAIIWVVCIAMFFVAQCAATIIYNLTSDPTFASYQSSVKSGNPILAVILTVVIAPTVEEILFRGIMFECLGKHMQLWIAALVSSIAFAASHATLVHLLPACCMGLFCCAIYVITGRLTCSVILHVSYNAFSLIAPYLNAPAVLFIPLVTIPLIFVMGAACCVIIKHPDKWRKRLCLPAMQAQAQSEQTQATKTEEV